MGVVGAEGDCGVRERWLGHGGRGGGGVENDEKQLHQDGGVWTERGLRGVPDPTLQFC